MYVAVVLEVASNDESVEPLRMIKIDMIESFRVKKKIEEKKIDSKLLVRILLLQ